MLKRQRSRGPDCVRAYARTTWLGSHLHIYIRTSTMLRHLVLTIFHSNGEAHRVRRQKGQRNAQSSPARPGRFKQESQQCIYAQNILSSPVCRQYVGQYRYTVMLSRSQYSKHQHLYETSKIFGIGKYSQYVAPKMYCPIIAECQTSKYTKYRAVLAVSNPDVYSLQPSNSSCNSCCCASTS